jgi:TrmH family RNA methyltransferase
MISRIETLLSPDKCGLEPYLTLKKPSLHKEMGIFVAEGNKVVHRFLESKLTAVSVLTTPESFEFYKELLEKKREPLSVFLTSSQELKKIVGFQYHQGIMATGKIPSPMTIQQIIDNSSEPYIFVALDRLESAENTGVIARNCAACGVQALLIGETSADPYLRRAVRNSMGNIFKIPVFYSSKLKDTLCELRTKCNFKIYAAHPGAASCRIYDADLIESCCIVFGNEGSGISEEILEVCDQSISIPMAPQVDSFNVACASAVILYEMEKQRLKHSNPACTS